MTFSQEFVHLEAFILSTFLSLSNSHEKEGKKIFFSSPKGTFLSPRTPAAMKKSHFLQIPFFSLRMHIYCFQSALDFFPSTKISFKKSKMSPSSFFGWFSASLFHIFSRFYGSAIWMVLKCPRFVLFKR